MSAVQGRLELNTFAEPAREDGECWMDDDEERRRLSLEEHGEIIATCTKLKA